MLWSHTRDIHIKVFPNKIVYDIPIYNETLFNCFKYKVEFIKISNTLRLTITKPTESLLK
jgi:hypothetical protein